MHGQSVSKGALLRNALFALCPLIVWGAVATGCGGGGTGETGGGGGGTGGSYVVLAYNDLGMHCMNEDFSELCILPPANTLRAQVIRRGEEPNILSSGVDVQYSIPTNTHSWDKTNFWTYVNALFGANLSNDMGLFGFGMSGTMAYTGQGDFWAHGIPITPLNDSMALDPYNLASVRVFVGGNQVASTQAVVPVSWEINCDLCHTTQGISVATDILRKHDTLHGTDLENQKPVLCASCHGDPALGAAGQQGVPMLSHAMHGAHASRMGSIGLANKCYACHPGVQTQCLRDVHYSRGLTCTSCHGDMAAVCNASRTPWVDEPRCAGCHNTTGHQYEQPGTLYRDSVGHHRVKCESCHGSPHAITPTVTNQDNVQAIALQGFSGVIRKCTVCHTQTPDDPFNHSVGGD